MVGAFLTFFAMRHLVTQIRVTLSAGRETTRRKGVGIGSTLAFLAAVATASPAMAQDDDVTDDDAGVSGAGVSDAGVTDPGADVEPEPEVAPEPAPEPKETLPPPGPPEGKVATVDPPEPAASKDPSDGEGAEDRTASDAATAGGKGAEAKERFIEAPLEPAGGPIAEDLEGVDENSKQHFGSFGFGSYGRVIAATDATGRPGRNSDITAWGSRLDLSNYAEIELRRNDHWGSVGADTRVVSTLALGNSIFHYHGDFDAQIAIRNLFIEERGLGLKGLSVWAGSRMLRGDDIYLLNMWPLDNLNTLGGGVQYDAPTDTSVRAHFGVAQPNNPFYKQTQDRAEPFNQFGTATVNILDRVRLVGSLRAQQLFFFSDERKAGMKVVLYGEAHGVGRGQKETNTPGVFEDLPNDDGFVVGGEIGAFTGERNTFVNAWVRYSTGLAAYYDFANPGGLGPNERASGAKELRVAASGNFEFGPVTTMIAGYYRSFRNASPGLDFEDLDEGIIAARPHVFFVDWAGLAVEGAFEAQRRGILADVGDGVDPLNSSDPQPFLAKVGKIGVVPFLSPAGRGSYSRPMIWFIYQATFRDAGARALYPQDDVFNLRKVSHFIGVGAEWWFSSTSYGQNYRYAPK